MDSAQNDRLAHFRVCECGQHGRIVFPDGRTGGEITSKEQSISVLQYSELVHVYQGLKIFPDEKTGHIQDEIFASTIPSADAMVSDHFRKVANTWNTAKLHQPGLNPEDFHKVADRLWHYDASGE